MKGGLTYMVKKRLKTAVCLALSLILLGCCFSAVAEYRDENGDRKFYDDNGNAVSESGIDISEWQENVDWGKVKAAGIDFVILRAGYRGYGAAGNMRRDSCFDKHIIGAYNAGLSVGVYFFSQAITAEEAKDEALFTLDIIEPYRDKISYPVVFDTEYCPVADARTNVNPISNELRTDMAQAFVDTVRDGGYTPMIYASPSWINDKMQYDRVKDMCDIWIAHWTDATSFSPYTMWQYTETGKVDGVSGNVDRNVSLVDYSTKHFTIKYNANGGVGEMADTECVYGESNRTADNAFSKQGYNFIGWSAYRMSDGKTRYINGKGGDDWFETGSQPDGWYEFLYSSGASVSWTSSVRNDIVVFSAAWENNRFTIKYDPNGGVGEMADTECVYGESNRTADNTFSKRGYNFIGWSAHRMSDGKTRYINGKGGDDWFETGSQPDGWYEFLYSSGASVSWTSAVSGDTVVFSARWRQKAAIKGDLDANGAVNLADVRQFIAEISSGTAADSYEKAVRDYNSDGKADLSDVRAIILAIAGGN